MIGIMPPSQTTYGIDDADVIQAHLMEKRAQLRAAVVLTGDPPVRILESGRDGWPDIVATLLEDGKDEARLFAVETKGLLALGDASDLAPWSQEAAERYRKLTFPALLFVFTSINDEGQWRWLKEPIASTGTASLVLHQNGPFQPLTEEVFQEILSTIRTWYESAP